MVKFSYFLTLKCIVCLYFTIVIHTLKLSLSKISHWYKKQVTSLYNNNIITGPKSLHAPKIAERHRIDIILTYLQPQTDKQADKEIENKLDEE